MPMPPVSWFSAYFATVMRYCGRGIFAGPPSASRTAVFPSKRYGNGFPVTGLSGTGTSLIWSRVAGSRRRTSGGIQPQGFNATNGRQLAFRPGKRKGGLGH